MSRYMHVKIRGFEIPGFEMPGFETPEFVVPGFEMPNFEIPGFLWNCFPGAWFSAPDAGRERIRKRWNGF